jgi:uncharacterized membrane protein
MPIKKYLLAGLLVWTPLAITVWVLTWLVGLLDGIFLTVLHAADTVLPGLHALAEFLRGVPGLGVILVMIVIFSTGVFVANIFGQWMFRQWDGLMNRIPVVRSIYSGVKQVSDTLFSENGNAFRTAVLVEWPREGAWTIGFVTGAPGGDVPNHLVGDYLSVYVPTTPNPTGGYFVMLRKSDCIELRMTVDEALRYVISMGVVAPPPPAAGAAPTTPTLPQ